MGFYKPKWFVIWFDALFMSVPRSVLGPLMREFHTSAKRVAFNAESAQLGLFG